MSKPQHVGTSADDLRQATRDANAAMKDAQATLREIRAAREDLNRAADSYADRVIAGVQQAMAAHAGTVNKAMQEVGDAAVKAIMDAIEVKSAEMSAAVSERLAFNPNLGAAPKAAFGESVSAPVQSRGFDMTVNGRKITQVIPCDTSGMLTVGGQEWPKHGPNHVIRKCQTCKRKCWVSPRQLEAHNNGAELLCVVCTSMLIRLLQKAGGQQITLADGTLVANADTDKMLKAVQERGVLS